MALSKVLRELDESILTFKPQFGNEAHIALGKQFHELEKMRAELAARKTAANGLTKLERDIEFYARQLLEKVKQPNNGF